MAPVPQFLGPDGLPIARQALTYGKYLAHVRADVVHHRACHGRLGRTQPFQR